MFKLNRVTELSDLNKEIKNRLSTLINDENWNKTEYSELCENFGTLNLLQLLIEKTMEVRYKNPELVTRIENIDSETDDYNEKMYHLLEVYPSVFKKCKKDANGKFKTKTYEYQFVLKFLNDLAQHPEKRIVPNPKTAFFSMIWLYNTNKDVYDVLYDDIKSYDLPRLDNTFENMDAIIFFNLEYDIDMTYLLENSQFPLEIFGYNMLKFSIINYKFWEKFGISNIIPCEINSKTIDSIFILLCSSPETAWQFYGEALENVKLEKYYQVNGRFEFDALYRIWTKTNKRVVNAFYGDIKTAIVSTIDLEETLSFTKHAVFIKKFDDELCDLFYKCKHISIKVSEIFDICKKHIKILFNIINKTPSTSWYFLDDEEISNSLNTQFKDILSEKDYTELLKFMNMFNKLGGKRSFIQFLNTIDKLL